MLPSFRSPQHFLLLWTFAFSILAGFGSEGLRSARGWFFVASFGMLSIAIAALFFSPLIVVNAGLSAIALSILYKAPRRILLGVFIFLDLLIFTRSNIITLPQSTVASWFEKSDALMQKIGSDGRIWVHKGLYPAPIQKQFGKFDWPQEAAWQVEILRPNINMLYHIASIDGYASMVSRDYQASFGLPATDPTGVNMGEINGQMLTGRGVDTVLAPPDGKYIQELYPLELWEWQSKMTIYRLARK